MAVGEEFSLPKLGGEYLREASVLIFVFGFLDPLVPHAGAQDSLQERVASFPGIWALAVVAVSMMFFVVGTLVEWLRLRPPKLQQPRSGSPR